MMIKLFAQQIRQATQNGLRRRITTATVVLSAKQTPEQLIDVSKALRGWDEKLKEAGVGDIDFNLKCLVAHVLRIKFVSFSIIKCFFFKAVFSIFLE